jgi:AcrR family transcriptional regulator
VSLDDVAAAAGVGIGTVYRRFANKHELITELFEQTVTEMAEATEAAGADPDTWHGLTHLCEWYCEHMAANRGFSEVMLELPDVTARFTTVRQRMEPAITHLIDKAVTEGVLRPGIVVTDLFAMINMVEAIANFAKPVNPELWRRYLAIILDGVRADDTSRPALTVPPLDTAGIEKAREAVFACRRG